AERAADPVDGGAWYVAGKLKQFCDAHPESVELHGMGHSAGAIFHCHFLSAAHHLRVPKLATLQFLAPAVRVDTFKQHLLDLLHKGEVAEKVTIFTMKKYFEKADDCAGVYRKSLLYLIFYALEEKRGTPILGLEESLRDDPVLKQLFCLDGKNSGPGEVIWSQSVSDTGRSASQSTSHGGFDDDPITMNSALLRILGLPDAGRITPYPRAKALSRTRAWTDEVDWPEGFEQWRQNASIAPPTRYPASPTTVSVQAVGSSAVAGGRRMALCIGINDYPEPEHRLAGCVADAQVWAQSLSRRGFSIQMLLDGQATREAIDRSIRELVTESRAGDVIVIQYSGHGTFVTDLNGDEEDNNDEALCPVDFASGALYIDDDIAEIFASLPDGVNLTCFMDCCHSGSNTRFAVGGVNQRPLGRDPRKRFVPPTEEINRAHALFRQAHGGVSHAMDSGGAQGMRDIKFAACQDDEVAWESDGHGEFTLRATRVLDEGSQITHELFNQRVVSDFGAQARQHPKLDCNDNAKGAVLLQPLQSILVAGPGRQSGSENAVLMQILQLLQQLYSQPGRR
ncbi:caspase family protein, partial [Pseudomonas rossensis]|uniref:caspase family protein n=1 Tax=Pseudomonas rossensis TaxID=2305471 RepID=UPI003261CE99